jgi:hypothetical protein
MERWWNDTDRNDTDRNDTDRKKHRGFFLMAQQTPVGHGLLIIEGSRSPSKAPQSVGLLWTIDQLVADLYFTTHNIHKKQTSTPTSGFEPATPSK